MPYSVEGDFGKVRMISHLPTQEAKSALNYMTGAGWHLCNEQYSICRDVGCDTYLVFFTVGGCGQMRIGDCVYPLPEKTAAILPANKPHAYCVPKGGEWEFYWLHMSGVSVSAMLNHIIERYGEVIPTGGRSGELFSGIEELLFLKGTNNPCFEVHASQIIATLLHTLLIALQEDERTDTKQSNVVKGLLKVLETNYSSKLSIEDISRSLYVNSAHLARLFKAKTGFTPHEYLTRYRIMISKELLLYTDLNVKEIAIKTGFQSASNFISQFKALEAVTPGDFRK